MDETINKLLADDYGFSSVGEIRSIDQGYLSRNWDVDTDAGRYFLKRYRFDDRSVVEGIQEVNQFFARHNIPTIQPQKNLAGDLVTTTSGCHFVLFPFIAAGSIHIDDMTEEIAVRGGKMLARIHEAGAKTPADITAKKFSGWDIEAERDKLTTLQEHINQVSEDTEFDHKAQEFIGLKLKLLDRIDTDALEINQDTLLHGDFHIGNLFFSDDEEIAHVFDFEKTRYGPALFELARSMVYMCFYYGRHFEGDNFALAEEFLSGYGSVRPINPEDLENGVRLYAAKTIRSIWILDNHYYKQNYRTDKLLKNRLSMLRYFDTDLGKFIDRLKGFLD